MAAPSETTHSASPPPASGNDKHSAKATDPPLLKQHSEIKTYTTSRFTYERLRIFYRRHPQADQLPTKPGPLPLLVFIHGLGGSVAQFHPLLTSLVNVSSCLAIDLPGCGVSDFVQTSWDAYSTDSLAELLERIIDEYRLKDGVSQQSVVFIAHSMGTALAARLANKEAPHATDLAEHVVGLAGICPIAGPPPEDKVRLFRRLLWIPGWLFDLWRAWDRRGGPESASVTRFVGPNADVESKQLQDKFNNQSRTPVWRRMAWGSLPVYEDGQPKGGIPSLDIWAGLDIPVYLIGGELDNVTSPKDVGKIVNALESRKPPSESEASESQQPIVDAAAPVNASADLVDHIPPHSIDDITEEHFQHKDKRSDDDAIDHAHDDPSTPQEPPTGIPPQPLHPRKIVKSIVLPPPATHTLLYTPCTVRIVAGLLSDFLACHITGRLSLGWQLQYLSREGKWDVKNLAKWKSVAPVSGPMGPAGQAPVFRAMKTLREADDTHTPAEFAKEWKSVIRDVVDISHDQPVYDPRGLERAGIRYHKFPTVSKVPPSDAEVEAFITLVDRLRKEQEARAKENDWEAGYVVGVHCHYGFNRTGYFIVCYLVERCGLGVQEAIDLFAQARPNGIRHSHFLDRLFVRFSGLKDGDSE